MEVDSFCFCHIEIDRIHAARSVCSYLILNNENILGNRKTFSLASDSLTKKIECLFRCWGALYEIFI